MKEGIASYGSPVSLGSAGSHKIFDDYVYVQEKVDGSQISFGLIDGELHVRSRGQAINLDSPGMFGLAVENIKRVKDLLQEGWVYRGEYLSKPKHNVLNYDRVPNGNIILFDIETEYSTYISPIYLDEFAKKIGMEAVKCYIYESVDPHKANNFLECFLENESSLGGCLIEGVVVKSYFQTDSDGKPLKVKKVSEAFKEKHVKDYKVKEPRKEALTQLTEMYAGEARWHKAIQHLREEGKITDSPRDIGPIIQEVIADLFKEETESIKDFLFNQIRKDLSSNVTRGIPDWYKNLLANSTE